LKIYRVGHRTEKEIKKKKRPLIQNPIYFSSTCPAPSNPVKTSLDPRQRGPIPDSSGE